MKRNYLLMAVMLLLSVAAASAQNYDDTMDEEVVVIEDVCEEEEIFLVLEEPAEFPGGIKKMYDFIRQNLKYPQVSLNNGSQGRVILRFEVLKDGRIDNITILKSSGDASLDNEAIRVVSLMPKWKPAMQNGRNVATWFALPLNFSLGDGKPANNKSDVK